LRTVEGGVNMKNVVFRWFRGLNIRDFGKNLRFGRKKIFLFS
jgi:hypothetical protein